jgi:hypothetical protein
MYSQSTPLLFKIARSALASFVFNFNVITMSLQLFVLCALVQLSRGGPSYVPP